MRRLWRLLTGKGTSGAKGVSVSTEPASSGVANHAEFLRSIIGNGEISHSKLNSLLNLFFGFTLKDTAYKLKECANYGVLFNIEGYAFDIDSSGKLVDIRLSFEECGRGSTLKLSLSAKEVSEFLEPVDLSKQPKDKETAG